jgi:hypothetical protein
VFLDDERVIVWEFPSNGPDEVQTKRGNRTRYASLRVRPLHNIFDINGVTGTGLVLPVFFFIPEENRRRRSCWPRLLIHQLLSFLGAGEWTEIGCCLTYCLLEALSWFTKRLDQTVVVWSAFDKVLNRTRKRTNQSQHLSDGLRGWWAWESRKVMGRSFQ